jgi:hypothetical protein
VVEGVRRPPSQAPDVSGDELLRRPPSQAQELSLRRTVGSPRGGEIQKLSLRVVDGFGNLYLRQRTPSQAQEGLLGRMAAICCEQQQEPLLLLPGRKTPLLLLAVLHGGGGEGVGIWFEL